MLTEDRHNKALFQSESPITLHTTPSVLYSLTTFAIFLISNHLTVPSKVDVMI